MTIKVLGPGCASCAQLLAQVEKAIQLAGVAAQIVKVDQDAAIESYGVRRTPALVIDDRLVASGIVLDARDIIPFLIATRGA